MERVSIERVGLPGRAWLSLQGTILLYHTQSWLGASTTFIPIEWVQVDYGARRDLRRVWLAIIALMTATLLALPCLLLLRQETPPVLDRYLATVLLALMAVCLLIALGAGMRLIMPRPYIRLRVTSEYRDFNIDFWRPYRDGALDALIERLGKILENLDQCVAFPIRMHHAWRRPRPYRLALLRGLLISAVILALLLLWDTAAVRGMLTPFPRVLYLVLGVLPAVHLAASALRRALWQDPRSYRRAVSAYLRQRAGEAEARLNETLGSNQDHGPARLLLIQLLTEQGRYDEAAGHCERLALDHPQLATQLQASLWGIKRLHARMREA